MLATQKAKGQRLFSLVEDLIWKKIENGSLKPGSPVVESKIAKEINVSQGVVHEVICKLEDQGVVESSPYKSPTLVYLGRNEVKHLIEIRERLEELAIESAQDRVSNADCRFLDILVNTMRSAANPQAFDKAHREFHAKLWSLSGNYHLVKILNDTSKTLFPFRIVTLKKKSFMNRSKDHAILVQALRGKVSPRIAVKEHLKETKSWADKLGEREDH